MGGKIIHGKGTLRARTSADGCAGASWRCRCSPWPWRRSPPRRRPAAPARRLEKRALSGGAGLVFSAPMRSAGATWYGPGLYGNGTACGQTLRPGTIGVAHRTLPCGTTVKINYHGHSLVTKVIDRGPYTPGNDFDLTNGARLALGFEGVGQVRYAVAVGSSG